MKGECNGKETTTTTGWDEEASMESSKLYNEGRPAVAIIIEKSKFMIYVYVKY